MIVALLSQPDSRSLLERKGRCYLHLEKLAIRNLLMNFQLWLRGTDVALTITGRILVDQSWTMLWAVWGQTE